MTVPQLAGRVALVTGASRGIGRHVASALAREGAQVVVVARNAGALASVVQEIGDEGGTATAIVADMADPPAIRNLFAEITERFERLDVVVNNAGVLIAESASDASLEALQRTLDVNLRGTVLCAQAAARMMAPAGHGSIINISSVFGSVGVSDHTAYAASKAGVEGLTKSLAIEVAPTGVRVNALAPGFILTDLNATEFEDEALRKRTERAIPLRRLGTPADLAPWVVLLATDASSYVTGSIITVDGGFTAR